MTLGEEGEARVTHTKGQWMTRVKSRGVKGDVNIGKFEGLLGERVRV